MNLDGSLLADRYEIIKKVGNGGMATVYKAKDTVLNRFVAVKILREDQANDEPIEVAVSNPTPGGTCDNMNEQYSGNTFNYSTCTPSNDCTKLTPNAATNMGSGGGGAAYITDKNAQSFQLYLCANNTKETRTYKTSFGSNKNTWEYWSGLAGCIKTANERNSFSFREVQGDYTGNGGRSGGGGVIITW